MKISECGQTISEKTKHFMEKNKIKNNFRIGATINYDLMIMLENGEEFVFEGLLLGTFKPNINALVFPFDRENSEVPKEDLDLYISLQTFAKKVGIVELTEIILSFDPLAVMISHPLRRMNPPQIYRNQHGEIESCYILEDIIGVAAHFHKCVAVMIVKINGMDLYIGITSEDPVK